MLRLLEPLYYLVLSMPCSSIVSVLPFLPPQALILNFFTIVDHLNCLFGWLFFFSNAVTFTSAVLQR